MNDRGPRRQTALQEIANESWNTELLAPVDAQLIESRPLMVFSSRAWAWVMGTSDHK